MYSDIALKIAIKYNQLALQEQIIIFLICCLLIGIGTIFYIRYLRKP